MLWTKHNLAKKLRGGDQKTTGLMGASQSSSSIYAYNAISNSVALKAASSCIAGATAEVDFTQSGSGAGSENIITNVNIDQDAASVNIRCTNKQGLSSAVSNGISQAMTSESESTPPSLFAGEVGVFNSSESNITAINDVSTSVKLQSFNKCISDARGSTTFTQEDANNTIDGIVINQNVKAALQDCINQTALGSSIANSIDQDLSSSSKATSNLSGMLEMIIILVIVIVVAYLIYSAVNYAMKKSGTSTPGVTVVTGTGLAGQATTPAAV
jgi:hypothetical protein